MDGTVASTIAEARDPTEVGRAERRAMRLASLAAMRDLSVEAMERLNDGSAGRLHYEEQVRFDGMVKDPYLAMSRLSREFCRIVMLEERLDEDAETRAKRLAEEEAERERRVRAQEAALKEDAQTSALLEKKRIVRDTVGRIHRDADPKLSEMETRRLLDSLLDGYELDCDDDLEQAYADTMLAVVRICEDAGIEVEDTDDPDKTPQGARRRLEAMVRSHLERAAAANGNAAEVLAPPALAQGPPG